MPASDFPTEPADRGGQQCVNCRFWRREHADRGPTWGQCRRMPPVLPDDDDDEKLVRVGIWPHTAADDWCGEWQPAAS
jgi:hypothetical protein